MGAPHAQPHALERLALPLPTVVIKRVDKGGDLVIQNKDDYIKVAMRQLSDTSNYKCINKDPKKHIMNIIKTNVDEGLLMDHTDKQEHEFLQIQ